MVSEYILAVDQGTSGTKAILFDEKGRLVESQKVSHQQYSSRSGWLEHDPEEIYQTALDAIQKVIEKSGVAQKRIINLAITNQRETLVVWDKETGEPVHNAIVWQDQRGKEFCEKLQEKGYEKTIREKTGLIVDPYFSASKLHWLLEHNPKIKEAANKDKLLMGTIDSWLIWKLTGGNVHATDYSNASRTMLFNIHNLQWDPELLDLFSVPSSMPPEVKGSNSRFGRVEKGGIIHQPIPISGVMGDSHAALFGQACLERGMTKATYGTGSSIMMNIGPEMIKPPSGLVTSIGWGFNGKVYYVLEGNIHCAGDVIQWLIEDLELIPDHSSVEQLAKTVEDNHGIYLVPALVGLGAPYWDNDAKGVITGLTRDTKKAHLIRAGLESIAYQVKDLVSIMINQPELNLEELRVDGGPTTNNFLMQFQADLLNVPVLRSNIEEVSALGATYMGGLSTGLWEDQAEIASLKKFDKRFKPQMSLENRRKYYLNWQNAVEKALSDDSYSIKKIVTNSL